MSFLATKEVDVKRRRSAVGRRIRSSISALMLVALVVFFWAWSSGSALPQDAPGGWPRMRGFVDRLSVTELVNPGFVVGYSEWHGVPRWVAYRADPPPNHRLQRRPARFEPDMRTWRCRLGWWCVRHESYRNSGFDRGHMAPNFLIGTRYGPEAQRATFLLSNVAPQRPSLNQGSWQRLEAVEADRFAPNARVLWVVTGPVFDEHPPRFSPEWIAVPKAFFRIFWAEDEEGHLRVLAFLMPQETPPQADLRAYLTTVRAIEAATGIDFFPDLPQREQDRLETAAPNPESWGLTEEWARALGRYRAE
jgi:endonuclease G